MVRIFRDINKDGLYHQIYGYDLMHNEVGTVYDYINNDKPPGWIYDKIKTDDIIAINDEYYSITLLDPEFNMIVCCEVFDNHRPKLVNNTITCVLVTPEKPAYKIEIINNLKALQSAVGGLIEPFYFDANSRDCLCYVNDEGVLLGLQPNRFIEDTVIFGNMLIVGTDDEGNDISLNKTQTKKYLDMFSESYKLFYDPKTKTLYIL